MISIRRFTTAYGYLDAINRLLPQLSQNALLIDYQKLVDLFRDQDTFVFAAIDDIKPVPDNLAGTATIFFQRRLEGTLAEIHSVVVDNNYRGQGIGDLLTKAMIDAAKDYAARTGGKVTIYLTSNPKRVAANALYQKHGFELVATATSTLNGTNLYKLVITP